MKRYLASLPPVSQRYSLVVLDVCGDDARVIDTKVWRGAVEQALSATQQRMLASYDSRDPEPFKLEAKPARGVFQGWRVP